MRIVSQEVYKFDELSNAAKEAARAWYRDGLLDYDWYDAVYEDAERIAVIFGIDLDRRNTGRKTFDGNEATKVAIYFSGFYSQGDGACFEGRYSYAKQASKKIRAYAPADAALHSIADRLFVLQKDNGYRLEARVRHSGHYYHSGCTEITVSDKRTGDIVGGAVERELDGILREFMAWIYQALENESDYLCSDEVIDESIRSNEYEFTAAGSIY